MGHISDIKDGGLIKHYVRKGNKVGYGKELWTKAYTIYYLGDDHPGITLRGYYHHNQNNILVFDDIEYMVLRHRFEILTERRVVFRVYCERLDKVE